MNVEELEGIIRDELHRDALSAPSGRQLRAAVLDAVAGVPMIDRPIRRWAVPLLVAAAVVALAVAATLLLPRALSGHGQPAHPKPSPSLPVAPSPMGMTCGHGQQLVSGAGARFTDAEGRLGYAYDYYCAGTDGSRTGSVLEWFRTIDGRLAFQAPQLTFAGANEYVMSLTGTDGGLLVRAYDASPGVAGHPGGVVSDIHLPVGSDGSTAVGDPIAQPCLATDLTVRLMFAYEPKQHQAMQLTNHSAKACAVWGNPRYLQATSNGPVTSRSVLRGPIGGLADEPSAPPLVLQPGQTASSAIGGKPVASCPTAGISAVLPNGVNLGALPSNPCLGDVVSYPLVRAENGSETHPELNAPASATGSCLDSKDLSFGFDQLQSGNRGRVTITLSAIGATSCTITGYPDVRVTDDDRNLQRFPFPAQTLRGPLGGLAGDRFPQVTVAPGHPATALVEWSENPADGRCDSAGVLWLTLGTPRAGGGPLPSRVCAIQAHPFVPGSTGNG